MGAHVTLSSNIALTCFIVTVLESVHEPQRRLGVGLWNANEGLQGRNNLGSTEDREKILMMHEVTICIVEVAMPGWFG